LDFIHRDASAWHCKFDAQVLLKKAYENLRRMESRRSNLKFAPIGEVELVFIFIFS